MLPSHMPIAVTCGCPLGIGPQVAAEALWHEGQNKDAKPFFFYGSFSLLENAVSLRENLFVEKASPLKNQQNKLRARLFRKGISSQKDVFVEVLPENISLQDALTEQGALFVQRHSLLRALEDAQNRQLAAICTAPIQKACLDDIDQKNWPGHTELFAHRLGDGKAPLMLFIGGPFLLGLASVHLPLSQVSACLTVENITHSLFRIAQGAQKLLPLKPAEALRISVLGLNPHAGEQGRLGAEEEEVILPAIALFKQTWAAKNNQPLEVKGPLPADGFFGHFQHQQRPHAVLAMYHDQGLAPYKMLTHEAGVNLTLGLTVPRTSPDHGTAHLLRRTGTASAKSMQAALAAACLLAASS